ncbi:MAG: HisA/HisF-related TIM barrel protein [Proteobacteria bacterium]|nr:HisA/HisF-related TIM barrel protein [Pseudomonadota bacterium]
MEFIFMLTRQDRTVVDAERVLAEVFAIGVRHIGFKDIGVDRTVLDRLNRTIKQDGGTSYMEVVSATPEACLASARVAAEIGVDCLLGGTEVSRTMEIVGRSGIAYFPFVGRPEGHPTRLGGDPVSVAEDCRRAEAQGCAGVDLLAYRATDSDPVGLIASARASLAGRLIVAGSIDSPDRVRDVALAGADAFTIGSAAFDGSFAPDKGALSSQVEDILAAVAASARHAKQKTAP